MYGIEITGRLKGLTWSAGHYVPDNEKCKKFHGHDYSIDILIDSGDVESSGMLMDFTLVKKAVKPVIESMDHKFIVPGTDIRKGNIDGMIDIVVRGIYRGTMPESDVFIFPYPSDTAEYIAKYCYVEIYKKIKGMIRDLKMKIIIHEGPGNLASYTE
ncbi:6-carboxytetrahydropterin synthase [Ferroplasma sp.]|uniref:6-pyruvoyl trahydropterin synthase family protein n=1 Tax=Ferroplasma sp. TaxID=2591003 RepID=UPI0026040503|nr:6-carboxytetrahydropterin synthase [Ferroplasma sp.]MCL4453236.1 6-carboxytetrahydropterin synthase [Candidatus Thermoplasmatota archaeon]